MLWRGHIGHFPPSEFRQLGCFFSDFAHFWPFSLPSLPTLAHRWSFVVFLLVDLLLFRSFYFFPVSLVLSHCPRFQWSIGPLCDLAGVNLVVSGWIAGLLAGDGLDGFSRVGSRSFDGLACWFIDLISSLVGFWPVLLSCWLDGCFDWHVGCLGWHAGWLACSLFCDLITFGHDWAERKNGLAFFGWNLIGFARLAMMKLVYVLKYAWPLISSSSAGADSLQSLLRVVHFIWTRTTLLWRKVIQIYNSWAKACSMLLSFTYVS